MRQSASWALYFVSPPSHTEIFESVSLRRRDPSALQRAISPNFFCTPARQIRIEKGAMNTGP